MASASLKKDIKALIPEIKKDVSMFLSSEEGKINKKDVAKISMAVLSLGIGIAGAMKANPTIAACRHINHTSY